MTSNRRMGMLVVVLAVVLILQFVAVAFLSRDFRAARSNTQVDANLATYRTGETQPESMRPGFPLAYAVTGEGRLAAAVAGALEERLAALPNVGNVTAVDAPAAADGPLVLVELPEPGVLWTPFYAESAVTAVVYYAYDGAAPWPRDAAVVMTTSPAVFADGDFAVADTSWGLISRPAYDDLVATALAEAIAANLNNDVFTLD